jgi:hypothetical protein
MEIEDIERYKIRYNIDKNSRKPYYVDNRMYLYAILFHIHNWSLTKIGNFFGGKDHATVRNALIQAHYIQDQKEFIKNTELLKEIYPYVIPPYNKDEEYKDEEHQVVITLNKKQYIDYLSSKDTDDVYEIVWQLTLDKMYYLNKVSKQKKNKYKH